MPNNSITYDQTAIINSYSNKLENRINTMSSNFYNNDNGNFIGKLAGIELIILLHSLELSESQLKIVQKAIINF